MGHHLHNISIFIIVANKVNNMNNVKTLTLAVSLLAVTQGAHALTPWANGGPNIIINASGGAAQDKAFGLVVSNTLAASGTVDTFSDVDASTGSIGGRWVSYYFTGNANLGTGLAGKKILLNKRIYGGAGYGVVPLIRGIPVEQLNTAFLPASAWVANGTQQWKQTIDSSNASKYLSAKYSDFGFLGVDPSVLLKPGTRNYPTPVNALITGVPEANWPTNVSTLPTANLTIISTGGLAYGVAVTADLYKALQAAEKRAGTLPSTVAVGSYNETSLPNLNHNFVASLLAGKIQYWDQVKIVDKTNGNAAISLVDPAILTDAGVAAPYKEATTGNNFTPVAVGLRNNGAAVGAVAYAEFLNYPSTANAFPPATVTADDAVIEDASLPIVKAPGGTTDTSNLLVDWQNGTNLTGWNNVPNGSGFANRWGVAINSADRNGSVTAAGTGGSPWRYVKIDGFAPTLENIAAGDYPVWSEGTVIFQTTRTTDPLWATKVNLFTAFAKDLGSPTVASSVNPTQAWGATGIFATTADPRGFTASIPFNNSNPVVPFTHKNGTSTHTDIVPVANTQAVGGLNIQLK